MITKTKKIRKRKFNLIFPIILIIGFLALVGFLVISNLKINQKRADLSARIESLKKEISDLETKNKEMKSGLSQAGEEGYIEKEARERLNLLNSLPISRVESKEDMGVMASKIKANHYLSVADAWIAALAKQRNAILVHKDPEFEQIESEIQVLKLPYKAKA